MKLNVVSGFLGSGKTTLITTIAEQAVNSGKKVAILVNEIGEIGIDDQFMKRMGLNVWEILGGCICCSLAAGIAETMNQLINDYHPEIVFMEPSGAANLSSLGNVLEYYETQHNIEIEKITIVDPLRIEMLYEVMEPLISSQIENADSLIVSKTDIASKAELEAARHVITSLNPDSVVYELTPGSTPDRTLLNRLL